MQHGAHSPPLRPTLSTTAPRALLGQPPNTISTTGSTQKLPGRDTGPAGGRYTAVPGATSAQCTCALVRLCRGAALREPTGGAGASRAPALGTHKHTTPVVPCIVPAVTRRLTPIYRQKPWGSLKLLTIWPLRRGQRKSPERGSARGVPHPCPNRDVCACMCVRTRVCIYTHEPGLKMPPVPVRPPAIRIPAAASPPPLWHPNLGAQTSTPPKTSLHPRLGLEAGSLLSPPGASSSHPGFI